MIKREKTDTYMRNQLVIDEDPGDTGGVVRPRGLSKPRVAFVMFQNSEDGISVEGCPSIRGIQATRL